MPFAIHPFHFTMKTTKPNMLSVKVKHANFTYSSIFYVSSR